MNSKGRIFKRIIKWLFENNVKAVLILFSVIFLFAYLMPEGGGGSIGFGSVDGEGNNVRIGTGENEKEMYHEGNYTDSCKIKKADSSYTAK